MYFGADYYPEHWPESHWEEDARLMAQAGINTVRLAEFAWSRIEPKPGEYDFEWLDRAVAVLASHDVKVLMGTPTANAPMWLFEAYPDCIVTAENGVPLKYGGRYNACHNHVEHRRLVRRLAEKTAQHYQDHSSVVAWHLHNEYGSAECYCENCRRGFHTWLEKRYGSLDRLNQAWGNVFWSLEYTNWDQIPVPGPAVGGQNPSLVLNYRRFYSDSVVEFAEESLDAVRPYAGDRPVLTNCQNFFKQNVDYQTLNLRMDVVATNNYPSSFRPMSVITAGLDLMRGIKDRGFWVVEQRSGMPGSVQLGQIGRASRPGELRLWTYQSIGHGADHILYFRWRTALFAQEQYWHGILNHDGVPRRLYEAVAQVGKELERLDQDLRDTHVQTPVALLHSYDQRWATSTPPEQRHHEYQQIFMELHQSLARLGVQVDVRPYDADFDRYRVVMVPVFYLSDMKLVPRLQAFAEQGGTVVFTFRSAVKDWESVITDQPLPGDVASLTGVYVPDYDALRPKESIRLRYRGRPDQAFQATRWADVLELDDAEALGWYADQFYQGQPAITARKVGRGRVIYIGSWPEDSLRRILFADILNEAGVNHVWDNLPESVEVLSRSRGAESLVFVLNHGTEQVHLRMREDLIGKENLFDGNRAGEVVTLPPAGVAIYKV